MFFISPTFYPYLVINLENKFFILLLLQIVVTVERVVPVVQPEKPSELCSIISNVIDIDSFPDMFNAQKEICMIALLTLNSNEDDTDGVIIVFIKLNHYY